MTQTLALEMIRITKTFGAVQALVDADLKVAKGTVHGLERPAFGSTRILRS